MSRLPRTRQLDAALVHIWSAHAPEFDYAIVNEDFETAVGPLAAIVTAARLRYGSQAARHHQLFAQLGIVG